MSNKSKINNDIPVSYRLLFSVAYIYSFSMLINVIGAQVLFVLVIQYFILTMFIKTCIHGIKSCTQYVNKVVTYPWFYRKTSLIGWLIFKEFTTLLLNGALILPILNTNNMKRNNLTYTIIISYVWNRTVGIDDIGSSQTYLSPGPAQDTFDGKL